MCLFRKRRQSRSLTEVSDGKKDAYPLIQKALNSSKVVKLPQGTFKTSQPIKMSSNSKLLGSGIGLTKIVTDGNGFDAIIIPEKTNIVELGDFTLSAGGGIGNNVGIRADGGSIQTFKNIYINNFKFGFKTGKTWWNNKLENIRFNVCETSFHGVDSGGQSINNLFVLCYSNNPLQKGWVIGGFKNTTFLGCNNGGASAKSYFECVITCKAISLIGCNFEDITLSGTDTAGIMTYGKSTLSIDSCTFVNNKCVGSNNAEVMSRDSSTIAVKNSEKQDQGAGMKDFVAINKSKIILVNNKGMEAIKSYGEGSIEKVLFG